MNKAQRLVQLFILLLGFILGGWGVGTAHADFTPDMFTGTWQIYCLEDPGCVALHESQSLSPMTFQVNANVTGLFSFNGSVSDYSDDGGCTPPTPDCIEWWGGSFSGGSVFFTAYDNLSNDVSFTGMITGGTFSGVKACFMEDGYLWCGDNEEGRFAFISPAWGKGWKSVGTFHFFSGYGPEPDMFGSNGTLTMTTTAVPEPSGMALLGSGLIAVASFVRWKLG